MKFCPKCRSKKLESSFHKNRSKEDGLCVYCKDCTKKASRASYEKNIIKRRQEAKLRMRKLSESPEYLAKQREKASRRYHEEGKTNPERQVERRYRAIYGMTVEEVESRKALQDHKCAICRRPQEGRRLAIDHCHKTKVIRGLLCVSCNLALGHFKDSPKVCRLAAEYLEKFPQQKAEEYQTKRQKQKIQKQNDY